MNKSTKEIENRIDKMKDQNDLEHFLKEYHEPTLLRKMEELVEKYNVKLSKIQVDSGISRSLFYAMISGSRTPKKQHVLRIAFALNLSLEETNELLKIAKLKELYAKNKEDAVILFGLKNNLSIYQIDELLKEIKSDLRLSDGE